MFTWLDRRYELPEPRLRPGTRNPAWWQEAGRPQYLTEHPSSLLDPETPRAKRAEMLDSYRNEPIIWLAENGHLTDEEVSTLAEEAREARVRIGTSAERIGSGGVDRADQRRVKLYEAVQRALVGD